MRSFFAQDLPGRRSGSKIPKIIWFRVWSKHTGYRLGQRTYVSFQYSVLTMLKCTKAAMRKLVREKRTAKIVFVGSTVSMMSFVGYAPYAPGKHALKGLAETLRMEGLLYGIDVHIFLAPTMDSPGLVEENKLKPAITSAIENGDEVLTCEAAAASLLRGEVDSFDCVKHNYSNSNRGAVLMSFMGPLYDLIAWVRL